MPSFKEKAEDFLAQERIAVAGVSRSGQATGNAIYKALKDRGYTVFALNPSAEPVDGNPTYSTVADIAGGVDGVIIVTSPAVTETIVQDCAEAGVPRVWMHNNTMLPSSVSEKAVAFCQEQGITVIDGGCPMMFLDFGHKCMRWVLGAMGRLPA